MPHKIFGKNGKILLDKNVGKDWAKGTGVNYSAMKMMGMIPPVSKRERERAAKRVASSAA